MQKATFNFEVGWKNIMPWFFHLKVDEKDFNNTGFEWVLRIQCFGLAFEWVKEYTYVNHGVNGSPKRYHVREDML